MEMFLTILACFCFMLVGAVLGHLSNRQISKDIISPLLSERHYVFRHMASHDLQVYHGIKESDWLSERPHEAQERRPRTDLAAEAERLAQEFERLNGDLPPTAE